MNGKCDWIGCIRKAKYKIQGLNIELCEKHYNIEYEPLIMLEDLPLLDESISKEIKKIVHVLKRNGKKMRLNALKQRVPTLNNNNDILEEMIINNLIQID